ncbi:uncharacterized protein DFL_002122 [Arthrobotrys flagrans]|uniref:Uncharacterized protein n=1 Tax=Arthrobotrys flagrans TaxID=97331 RepID=A0A437A9L0_ARTFL|nr:hypothetical protein DFL_002122 [Arthrobotrys flagrans]
MHFSTLFTTTTVALVSLADIASAHVVLADAYGNANAAIHGYAFGVDASTPRKGSALYPHQRDVTVFSDKVVHDAWHKGYQLNGCGTTLQHTAWYYQKYDKSKWFDVSDAKRIWLFSQITPAKGFIDIPAAIGGLAWHEWKKNTKMDATGTKKHLIGIPKVTAGGALNVLAFQINADGGGAFKCKIDYKANGKQWHRQLVIRKNCPGDANSINWAGVQKWCWFTVNIPADLNCQGRTGSKNEVGDICVVRCENSAKNGPFGGCIPIQQIRPKPKVVPVVKPVVSVKPVPVTIIKTVKPIVAPPKPVTVIKNNVVTIIKDGQTKTSVVTKNAVVTLTQVINPPPKTTVEVQYKTVTVEKPVLSTKTPTPAEIAELEDKDGENDDANKPQPEPKPPTKEEIKEALAGEDYPEEDIKDIKNDISEEDKEKIKEASGKEKNVPDDIGEQPEEGYY